MTPRSLRTGGRAEAARTPGTSRLKPLIKWPGGKSRELEQLLPHTPRTFDTYLEPFVGGGAAFFALAPERPAHLNDINPRLMDFYQAVASREARFIDRLDGMATDWDRLGELAGKLWGHLENRLLDLRAHPLDRDTSASAVRVSLRATGWTASGGGLETRLIASILDKFRRIVRLEDRHSMRFRTSELARHLETAVRSAYYMHLRDGDPPADPAAAAAEFFFIREYCYGSMFRFNAEGRFNIPYGGLAYNRKRFRKKVDYLLSDRVGERLRRCHFTCLDFETFLDRRISALGAADFVFLDPPYDSDFSSYDNLGFRLDDHERLAGAIDRLPCRWLLVIKETPDVSRIYAPLTRRDGVTTVRFAKSYTYNVRGRNDREAVHLVFARS